MEFRTIYSTRSEDSQTKKAKTFEKFSMTDQRFKDETDVNMILARYRVTGDKAVLGLQPSGERIRPPQYGDFSEVGTYQECLEVVMNAQEQFDALPASVRKEVGNTPEGMLQFISNPDNYDRGVELGIFEKRVEVVDNVGIGDIVEPSNSVSSVNSPSNKVTDQ